MSMPVIYHRMHGDFRAYCFTAKPLSEEVPDEAKLKVDVSSDAFKVRIANSMPMFRVNISG
jgi:hypothetical protein